MNLLEPIKTTASLQLVWLSKEAKKVWENPIKQIAKMVEDLEIKSVAEGQRACAWKTIDSERIPEYTRSLAEKFGLILYPVKTVGKWEGFSHRTIEPVSGKPTNTYCIVAKTHADAIEFQNGFNTGDHFIQGKLLGFPKCCTEFFIKNWNDGIVDPIWQMAGSEDPHPWSNPLLRYIGIRSGFHIPCSFNCKETIRIGDERAKIGYPELIKLERALLSMPMSWDNYHGVSIVRTPIFQIIYQSNPARKKYFLKVSGSFIPRESVSGNVYPNTLVKNRTKK